MRRSTEACAVSLSTLSSCCVAPLTSAWKKLCAGYAPGPELCAQVAPDYIPLPGPSYLAARRPIFYVDHRRPLCGKLEKLGFTIVATKGTAEALKDTNIKVKLINKVLEGRPHIVDAILNKEIDMIINTTEGRQSIKDSFSIRRSALEHSVLFTTTVSGGFAIVESLEKGVENWTYKPLQET